MALRIRFDGAQIVAYQDGEHRLLTDGCLVVEGNEIRFVGGDRPEDVDEVIDARGLLVTPGLINTHAHLAGSALDKSYIEDSGVRQFYMSGLAEMLPARVSAMDHAAEVACVEYSMVELLHTGTTTVMEIGGIGDVVADAAERFGLRAYIANGYSSGRWRTLDGNQMSYEWKDDGGIADFHQAVAFIESLDGRANGRISGFLSPMQVATSTPELLRLSREASERLGVPLALHVSEAVFEFHEMIRRHGQTPLEWLNSLGFLNEWCILGHVIFTAGNSWVQTPGDDLAILARTGASVAHCTWVFARRGLAMESFSRYQDAGVNMCLGTDTAPQSMIEAMRWAAVIGKIMQRGGVRPSAREIFDAATINAAKMLHRDDLGRVAPGAKADLLFWDLNSLFMVPVRDPLKNLVYSAAAQDLKDVMIDGQWAMRERVVLGGDEAMLCANLQAAGERMWDRIGPGDWAGRTVDELSPMSLRPFVPERRVTFP